MSPWAALAAVVLWVSSLFGAYLFGSSTADTRTKLAQAEIDKAIAATSLAANQGAADAISKIKITNTTVQGKLRTVVQNSPVYRDCVADPDAVRLLNDALGSKGRANSPVSSVVP